MSVLLTVTQALSTIFLTVTSLKNATPLTLTLPIPLFKLIFLYEAYHLTYSTFIDFLFCLSVSLASNLYDDSDFCILLYPQHLEEYLLNQ